MKMKLIIASAVLAGMTSVAAAQDQGNTTTNASGAQTIENQNDTMEYASDDEETMWTTNREYMGGFFTDDTMAELRSEEEITTAYGGLTADQQAQLKSDCEAAELNRGNYGEVSLTLCSQLSAL